jgi:hypothetical protein
MREPRMARRARMGGESETGRKKGGRKKGRREGWRKGGMGAGHSGMRLVERFGVEKLGTTKGTNGGSRLKAGLQDGGGVE